MVGLLTFGCFTGLVENLVKIGYEEENAYIVDYDQGLSLNDTEHDTLLKCAKVMAMLKDHDRVSRSVSRLLVTSSSSYS